MQPDPVSGCQTPCPVRVVVRLSVPRDAARHASIEYWTPAGSAFAPQPAPDPDLTLVLQQAAELSEQLGFHRSFELLGTPDDVAAYVQSWPEKRTALDELRLQRTQLQAEASVGVHRADGTRKTDVDRATARAMMQRLSGLRESLLRRGFVLGGGTTEGP